MIARAIYLDVKRRDLGPEQNDRVRAALRKLLVTYRSETALAKALEVKQPTISSVLSGRHGTSWGLLHRVAKLAGVPASELLGETGHEGLPLAFSPSLGAFLASPEGRALALTPAEIVFVHASTDAAGHQLTATGYLELSIGMRRAVAFAVGLHSVPNGNTVSDIRTAKKKNG